MVVVAFCFAGACDSSRFRNMILYQAHHSSQLSRRPMRHLAIDQNKYYTQQEKYSSELLIHDRVFMSAL